MNDENKPIRMDIRLKGGLNSVIPKGITERMLISCRDGSATFHFNSSKVTKEFAIRQAKEGTPSQYIERLQTTICYYGGKDKKWISEHILNRLKELANAK